MEFTTKTTELQMASFDQTGSIKNLKELKVGSGENAWIKPDGQFFFGDKDENKYIEYDGTDLNISGTINVSSVDGLGDLALLDDVGTGQLNTTIISGGKIVTGLLTANNIQTGTLTGVTIASSSGGAKIQMTTGDILEFYYGGSRQGYIRSESSGNMRISADDNIDFRCAGSVRASIVSGGIMPSSDFGQDLGREGTSNNRWRRIYGETFYGGSSGTAGDTGGPYGFLTALKLSGSAGRVDAEGKYRTINVYGGIVKVSSETDWVYLDGASGI